MSVKDENSEAHGSEETEEAVEEFIWISSPIQGKRKTGSLTSQDLMFITLKPVLLTALSGENAPEI